MYGWLNGRMVACLLTLGFLVTWAAQANCLDEQNSFSMTRAVARRDPVSGRPKTISVATFNVCNWMDREDDPYHEDEVTRAKSSRELKRLAATLTRLDADIVALQEVESRGLLEDFVRNRIGHLGYQHCVHYEGNDPRGIDVALLSRFPVGPVTSHAHLRFLDQTGKQVRFSRDLLCVPIHPKDTVPLEVWVVHLKSNYDGREAAAVQRLAETQQIRRIYDERLRRDPRAAIILCGDFNEDLSGAALQWLLASPRLPLQSLVEDLPRHNRYTYNRSRYRSMVDFLLVSPAMAHAYQTGSHRILSGTAAEIGSDHNPVIASFGWTREPRE